MPVFSADQLRTVAQEVFKKVGSSAKEAQLVADLLVKSNLAGHDSHGVIRIPWYVQAVKEGRAKPGAKVSIVRETPTMALIDGHWGWGQVVATRAMELAIKKAKKSDVSAVGAINCWHIGRLADYSLMALKHNMIGVTMVNSSPLVAPYGGSKRILSTNPMAFAIPAGKEKPFLLDMATSVGAEGKMRVKLNRGEKVPDDWLLDKEGRPTNNPADLYAGGALLPFGATVGYKGYGLCMLVDILCGALTGGGCTSSKEYLARKFFGGNGTFVMAINIASFTPVSRFKARMDELIKVIKQSPVAQGFTEILIPGEPEYRSEEKRLREGIPIEEKTWQDICQTAKGLGLNAEKIVSTVGVRAKR